MDKKLRPKYVVQRLTEEGLVPSNGKMMSTNPEDVDSPFVLMPRKDPAAFAAMVAYAGYCEPSLASEIKAWLRDIAEATPLLGTQGTRNYRYVRLRSIHEALDS